METARLSEVPLQEGKHMLSKTDWLSTRIATGCARSCVIAAVNKVCVETLGGRDGLGTDGYSTKCMVSWVECPSSMYSGRHKTSSG